MTVNRTYVVPNGVEGFAALYGGSFRWSLIFDVVVYEDFEIDGTKTGSWASEVIGAMKFITEPTQRLVRQRRQDKWGVTGYPSEIRNGSTQQRETYRFNWLRDKGFEGLSSHELDAITHALVFLRGEGHVPTLKEWYS